MGVVISEHGVRVEIRIERHPIDRLAPEDCVGFMIFGIVDGVTKYRADFNWIEIDDSELQKPHEHILTETAVKKLKHDLHHVTDENGALLKCTRWFNKD